MGVVAVRVFQPPALPTPASTSANTGANSRSKPRRPAPDEEAVAEAESAPAENGVVVPELVGLEEGDARGLITRSGFRVGSVTFRGASEPLGTVVASIPVPGEAVVLPATISIILSDGKGRPDSLANQPQPDAGSGVDSTNIPDVP